MLRRTNARRQQSASESTDEKHGAWAQDRDVGGVGGIPPPSPSLSVVSGSDDHQPDYLLANTATGKHVHTTTTTTGGGGGGGGGPHHHHQYKRMPSYTLNRNAVWCGGRKSLSSQSSSSCITIQELRQRNAAPVGGVGGGGGAGRRRRCCRRLLLATSIALCAFLVWEIGGSLRAIYAMERRWSAEDAGGGRGVDGGGEGPLGSRSAAVPRPGPPLVPGMMKGLASFADEWSGGMFPGIAAAASAAAGGGGPTATRDDGASDDAARFNARLRSQKHALEREASTWEAKSAEARGGVSSLERRIDVLRNDAIRMQEGTLQSLRMQLGEESRLASEYRDEFLKTHERTSGGIVAGGGGNNNNNNGTALGPGHVVKIRREIQKMDSLEDYENYIEDRENALWARIDVLVDKIKKDSRREAIEWFGPGPHTVVMEIEYPEYADDRAAEHWPRKRGVLLFDMAPLDLMPVAVNLFLQQVHHGLWDGCYFAANAYHVLQAGPIELDLGGGYNGNAHYDRFHDAKLESMPFQEYHEGYPHERHTVGFSGRPGGPDFYINKVDNTENHGPGGQDHHDLHEEADSCFAKLREPGGGEMLDLLNKIPTYRKGDTDFLMHPVVIVNAKVISSGGRHRMPAAAAETRDERSQQKEWPIDVRQQ